VVKLVALAEAFGQVEYAFELQDWLAGRDDVMETPLALKVRDVMAQGNTEYGRFSARISCAP
jgi:hypothetical protein